jgi:hypothetical protein
MFENQIFQVPFFGDVLVRVTHFEHVEGRGPWAESDIDCYGYTDVAWEIVAIDPETELSELEYKRIEWWLKEHLVKLLNSDEYYDDSYDDIQPAYISGC